MIGEDKDVREVVTYTFAVSQVEIACAVGEKKTDRYDWGRDPLERSKPMNSIVNLVSVDPHYVPQTQFTCARDSKAVCNEFASAKMKIKRAAPSFVCVRKPFSNNR